MPNSVVPFRTVAAYVPAGATMLGLGLIGEVFSDRRATGGPGFTLVLCADRRGRVRTDLGAPITVDATLDDLVHADLVVALPGDRFREPPTSASVKAFRAAYARGAIVASHCVGTYLVAASALLDNRRASTHWRFAADLATRYPKISVDAGALYVDEGQVITGAGAAAGIDMCLHLVRREHGAAAANVIARDLVMSPYRHGGQAQFVPAPVPADPDDERLSSLLAWARSNLDQRMTINDLASRALLSRRTLLRRFRDATGSTPHAWLLEQRLNRAEDLLESSNSTIEEVARQSGFGTAAVLREPFVRRRGLSPQEYRRTFRGARSPDRRQHSGGVNGS